MNLYVYGLVLLYILFWNHKQLLIEHSFSRCLRCLMNFIHTHLMLTFILRNIVWLIMQVTLSSITDANQTVRKLKI